MKENEGAIILILVNNLSDLLDDKDCHVDDCVGS